MNGSISANIFTILIREIKVTQEDVRYFCVVILGT